MLGYNNSVLRVDLSSGRLRVEAVSEEVLELFLGGKGLGTYYIYREVPPGTDPLGPGNKIVFAAGGLSGLVPGGSKVSVVSKSPLTRLITDTQAGDLFGPMLKRSGFDAVIIEGVSEKPVYIWIDNGEFELRDASDIWGEPVSVATARILRETRRDASIAVIGPAGEKLVRYACIMFDVHRAAGRGGIGAVMGSKKLKGIAVYGRERPPVYDPSRLEELSQAYFEKFASDPKLSDMRKYGTTNGLRASGSLGMSPSYNYNRPYIPDDLASKLAGDEVLKLSLPENEVPENLRGKSCPIKCSRYVITTFETRVLRVKPEYESLAMLGAATGVFNLQATLYFNHLVNEMGLDSISTGNTIAWYLELVEKGLIEDWGTGARGFGDIKAIEKLILMIANRRGIGAVLAEGVKRASEILGVGAELAVHVKGLEAPAWDPRGRRGFALSYATADVGASHLRGWPKPHMPPSRGPAAEMVESLVENRDWSSIMDHSGICKFMPYKLPDVAELYRAVTGLEITVESLRATSLRTESLARIHGVLDWVTPPLDDHVPRKWMVPAPEGPAKGSKAFLSEEDRLEALRAYYRARGWDEETGVPLPETLRKLGLDEAAGDADRAIAVVRRRLGLTQ